MFAKRGIRILDRVTQLGVIKDSEIMMSLFCTANNQVDKVGSVSNLIMQCENDVADEYVEDCLDFKGDGTEVGAVKVLHTVSKVAAWLSSRTKNTRQFYQ